MKFSTPFEQCAKYKQRETERERELLHKFIKHQNPINCHTTKTTETMNAFPHSFDEK